MQKLKFTYREPGCDRRHYISEDEVLVVLKRLPEDLWQRLRAVHFTDRSMGARILGYVHQGHREISICALPPRVSLTRALIKGQSCQEFGAKRGTQWPELAVRRFMLYDVFLHELGHLQLINEKAKSDRLKFAREKLAERFADRWRRELWAERFNHPDPIHNAPTSAEHATLQSSAIIPRANAENF
jgi:hypothetical protein